MCRPVFEQTARLSKMFFPGKRGMRGNKKVRKTGLSNYMSSGSYAKSSSSNAKKIALGRNFISLLKI